MLTAHTARYTLSLHDALPISAWNKALSDSAASVSLAAGTLWVGLSDRQLLALNPETGQERWRLMLPAPLRAGVRSEEHTSELQSHSDIVCRLLLEKKKERKQH